MSSVTGGSDALGAVTITVEADGRKVTGRGVATDVVEASARAYLNAVNKIVRLRERGDEVRRDRSRAVSASANVNLWVNAEHALSLPAASAIRSRTASRRSRCARTACRQRVERVLDLGTGDGNTLALVLAARPGCRRASASTSATRCCGARVNASPATRASRSPVTISTTPLPDDLGEFDLVVSSFAIHHLVHPRQRALYGEVFDAAAAGRTLRERRTRRVAK